MRVQARSRPHVSGLVGCVAAGIIVTGVGAAAAQAPQPLRADGAQRASEPIGTVENLQVLIRGARVEVVYDLVSNDPSVLFSARLEVSADNGVTYGPLARILSGDVGASVTRGIGKRIVWDAAKDVETLELEKYRFRVVLEPVQLPAPSSAARTLPAAPAPLIGPPVSPPPAPAISPDASAAMQAPPRSAFQSLSARLRAGDSVEVVETGGRRSRGHLSEISASEIGMTVDGRELKLAESSVARILIRRPDSVWNGMAIFAGIGAGAAAAIAVSQARCRSYTYFDSFSRRNFTDTYCDDKAEFAGAGALVGAMFAAPAGLIIDALRHRYEEVYSNSAAPSVAITFVPEFRQAAVSASIALGF